MLWHPDVIQTGTLWKRKESRLFPSRVCFRSNDPKTLIFYQSVPPVSRPCARFLSWLHFINTKWAIMCMNLSIFSWKSDCFEIGCPVTVSHWTGQCVATSLLTQLCEGSKSKIVTLFHSIVTRPEWRLTLTSHWWLKWQYSVGSAGDKHPN